MKNQLKSRSLGRVVAWCLGAVVLLVGLSASAEPAALTDGVTATCAPTAKETPRGPQPIPKDRLVLNDLSIFRYNPIGLETQIRFGWQHRLYEAEDSAAKRDNFVFAGTYTRLNPASLRVAGMLEFQPVSLLNLRFTAEYIHYYGNFSFMQSRPSAYDNLGDADMKANKTGPLGNYAASGFHATFEPLLQFKVGPIAVRSRAFLGWFDMNLQRGDRVWYESTLDTAIPGKGMVFANDLDVLYGMAIGKARLNIGARYSVVAPMYTADQILPTQTLDGLDNNHHRVGLLAAYTLYDDGYTAFNKPTVLLISSWYLTHRYRAGQEVSRGLPYIVLGFAFQSDLLDVK